MLIDLVYECQSSAGLVPQVLAATAQGSSIDFSNCEVSTNAIVSIGAFGSNSTQLNVQIEESTDGSTSWTAISGMTCSATTSNTLVVLQGLRQKQYVRANAITISGATPSIATSVAIVSQKKYSALSSSVQSGASISPAG